jgi:BirA family biotin operon repressor/biotin-[acetyl-CoA-carboxylase] ligase
MDETRLAAAVAETLAVSVADAPVEVLGTVPNTSDRVRAMARGGAPDGAFAVAESLTAARGRDGNEWSAPPGGVWANHLVRTGLDTETAGRLTVAGGLATCEAVRAHGVDAGIKWPNDVVVGPATDAGGDERRKLAGVLTELVVEAVPVAGKPVEDAVPGADPEDLEFATVGVGVNADMAPDELDAPAATTLRAERGEPVDPTEVAADLHERLVARCRQVETDAGFEAVLDAWRDLAVTVAERVRATHDGGETVVGTAVDVTDTGALVVEGDDGDTATLTAGTVENLRRA